MHKLYFVIYIIPRQAYSFQAPLGRFLKQASLVIHEVTRQEWVFYFLSFERKLNTDGQ